MAATGTPAPLDSIEATAAALAGQHYLADEELASAAYLAAALELPLLLEGEPGVGKTELGLALAAARGARPIRLQCHEGVDVHSALYDWDYPRQLLAIRAAEAGGDAPDLFSRRFLIPRPLLEAIESEEETLLLIDEIDRADEEFEALLLELLADFQVTIPEVGTLRARRRPLVVLTSNRSRELHDALKRRCLYHWIDFPDPGLERRIVVERLPGVPEEIAARIVAAVGRLRDTPELYKAPGIGETIAWTRAMLALGEATPLERGLGAALKVREDVDLVRERRLLDGV